LSNVYECLFILDSNKYARDPSGAAEQVQGLIGKSGGEVLVSRLWNEQKLAYPIDGHRKGTYWLTYFRMEGPKISEFKRSCELNELILRSMVIKPPAKLADVLVEHARTGGAVLSRAAPEAPAKAEAVTVPELEEGEEGVEE
jgi:small subunit ribosomal protein S6